MPSACLEPLLVVRVVWEGTVGYKVDAHKTIGAKMQAAEVQRLDVVQYATVGKKPGKDGRCGV